MKLSISPRSGHQEQTNGDLLALWRFDEASGTAFADEGGSYGLAAVNAPAKVDGLFALNPGGFGALRFNGTNQYAFDIPTASNKTLMEAVLGSQFTVEGWFSCNDTNTARTVVGYGGTSSAITSHNRAFSLGVVNEEIRWEWDIGTGTIVTGTTTGAEILDGEIYHIAMVVRPAASGTSGERDVTIDVWTLDGTHFEETFLNETAAAVGNNAVCGLYFGVDPRSNRFFSGDVDDFRISNVPLDNRAIRFSFANGRADWDEAVLQANQEHDTIARILIEDGDGDMQDMSALSGHDFVVGCEWGEDVATFVDSGTVSLWRAAEEKLSLARDYEESRLNLNAAGSYDPAVTINRRLYIEVATVPGGRAVEEWMWVPDFDAIITAVEWGSETIDITFSDPMYAFSRALIKTEQVYSGGGTDDIEDVISEMISDATPASGYLCGYDASLYVPTATGAGRKQFTQTRVQLDGAITAEAGNIGWMLKYKFDSDRVAFRLTLFEPERTKTAVDLVVGSDFPYELSPVGIDFTEIKNSGEVRVEQSGTSDTDNGETITLATDSDAASISKYGEHHFIVSNAWNIDTITEGNTLLAAIIADRAEPKVVASASMRFDRRIENGDLLTFEANNLNTDQDVDAAVTVVRKSISANERPTITVGLRAKPSGNPTFYNGIMMSADDFNWPDSKTPPSIATSVVVRPRVEGNYITWSPTVRRAGVRNWDYAELHAGATAGFAPSNTSLIGIVRGNSFEHAVDPLDEFFYKVIHRDIFGFSSAASASTPTSGVAAYTAVMPACHAYRATTEVITSSGKQVSINTEVADVGGLWDNAGSQISPPVDGWYVVGVRVELIAATKADGEVELQLRQGSSTVHRRASQGPTEVAAGTFSLELSGPFYLLSGNNYPLYLVYDHSKLGNLTVQAGQTVTYIEAVLVAHDR